MYCHLDFPFAKPHFITNSELVIYEEPLGGTVLERSLKSGSVDSYNEVKVLRCFCGAKEIIIAMVNGNYAIKIFLCRYFKLAIKRPVVVVCYKISFLLSFFLVLVICKLLLQLLGSLYTGL